jgi:GAF domain-containing protein
MKDQAQLSPIKQVIQAASQEQYPYVALQRLLEGVAAPTKASSVRAYLLRLDKSAFLPELEAGDPGYILGERAQPIDVAVLEQDQARSFIEKAIRSKELQILRAIKGNSNAAGLSPNTESCLLVPIVRVGSCLGLLCVESPDSQGFSDKDLHTVETAAAIVLSLIEKRAALDLLRTAQHPIDFYQPLSLFLDETLLVIASASGMPFGACQAL